MSVQTVELLWEGWQDRDGIDRRREYVRVYEVLCDNKYDTQNTAAGQEARNKGLPGNGHPLSSDSSAVVVDIRTARDTPWRWLVTCVYNTAWPSDLGAESLTLDPFGGSTPTDTAPGSDGSPPAAQRDPNPVNWPIVYSVNYELSTEPATHDVAGEPITNSAGDPFNPPAMIEVARPVLTFVKYYAFVDVAWLEDYANTVNGSTWKGRGARTCRMALDWSSETMNNFPVWKVTYRVKIKPGKWDGGRQNDEGQGWDLRILDQGYREWLGGLLLPISAPRDDYGNAAPGPFPLDGEGTSLSRSRRKPCYITRRVFKEADWSRLGL